MPYLWKAMKAGLRSGYDGSQWKIGKWRKVKGKLKLYSNGFHASENIIDAMRYTNMEVLAKVEVRGEAEKGRDKQAWTEMRVVKAWEWKKEDSVALAVYAANLVLSHFEEKFPDDKRPRETIQLVRKWLKDTSGVTRDELLSVSRSVETAARYTVCFAARSTARSAWSVWSTARSAVRSTARSAVRSTGSAAKAAWSAVWSAAWSAAWSVESTAECAAYQETLTKCHKWIVRRTKRLTPIEKKGEK